MARLNIICEVSRALDRVRKALYARVACGKAIRNEL